MCAETRHDVARAPLALRALCRLRQLNFRDDEVLIVARAIFVSQSEEDYSRVFDIFDTDQGGGIDPFEFKSLAALLGEHSTEAEVATWRTGP